MSSVQKFEGQLNVLAIWWDLITGIAEYAPRIVYDDNIVEMIVPLLNFVNTFLCNLV